ncbi:MAG: hypothetical protein A2087_01025 [Spirochaetes bacterium GWD1_61_31]|nr:MAG: hypothetical protein A2Y37_06550 [Spirochaetes bacterium GWB1_60_80]OHD30472.1 MAG: hypothetical protein A2004_08030 [Spirochaetes bacterium GWC1_61_12]OHD41278.1 MAG: hypothetical protein A2087_01025 [Spirochaetes bacterium GWD1_61_31]OHD44424.1 MAG: hypothetical protein A2Y35_09925 [Spirochaetes bacterium GWE1_60_18]OHD60842.1 MAG: hypothetical protein A2Y32_11570 [Spirochaetes bacterium GWF1_60_12]HAW86620.1 hypothetical protein [Spirochaetaceae bacterium]
MRGIVKVVEKATGFFNNLLVTALIVLFSGFVLLIFGVKTIRQPDNERNEWQITELLTALIDSDIVSQGGYR